MQRGWIVLCNVKDRDKSHFGHEAALKLISMNKSKPIHDIMTVDLTVHTTKEIIYKEKIDFTISSILNAPPPTFGPNAAQDQCF